MRDGLLNFQTLNTLQTFRRLKMDEITSEESKGFKASVSDSEASSSPQAMIPSPGDVHDAPDAPSDVRARLMCQYPVTDWETR